MPTNQKKVVREYGLRRKDPPGTFNNILESDLKFIGPELLVVKDVWNDDRTTGTRFDGEIYNRLAIYEKHSASEGARFVVEQVRCSYRVLFRDPKILHERPLPLMSLAGEFGSFADTVDWIVMGPFIAEGRLRELLAAEVERHT